MSRENRKRAGRLFLAVILFSLAIIIISGYVFNEKGLNRLEPPENSRKYYQTM